MRRILSGCMAAALAGLAFAACGGGGGPQSPQAFCKTFKPINDKLNADFGKLQGGGKPAEVKTAVSEIIAQAQKVLDDNPPKAIASDIKTAHDAFVSLQGELAKVSFDLTKLQGPPQAIQDPKFQKAGNAIDAYGLKYCGIQPQNGNNGNNNQPSGPAPAAPAPDIVAVQNFQYSTNTVPSGTKLAVKNLDQAPHTVTADDKSFDSGIVNGGATGTFTAPRKAGTYPYHCTVHSNMTGTLTVS